MITQDCTLSSIRNWQLTIHNSQFSPAGVLVRSHDMTPYMDIVRDFIKGNVEE